MPLLCWVGASLHAVSAREGLRATAGLVGGRCGTAGLCPIRVVLGERAAA